MTDDDGPTTSKAEERRERMTAAAARKAALKRFRAVAGEPPGSSIPPTALAQQTKVVRLKQLLDAAEIEAVMALGTCLPWTHPDPTGGRRTTYLSANGCFTSLLPDISAKLVAAARGVDGKSWKLLQNRTIAPRCVEYHKLQSGRDVLSPEHTDYGSLLTMDVMLNDPSSSFDGGGFQTLEADGSVLAHPFERGDALVFLSHKCHHVAPVLRGERRVLIMELWEGVERLCPHRCAKRLQGEECALGHQQRFSQHEVESMCAATSDACREAER